uniref:LIM zinc-binding domain-containing protein n=1 Tax=Lygus hesperus TaxID=30085 RepID=A0A0K8SAF7_LYGHE
MEKRVKGNVKEDAKQSSAAAGATAMETKPMTEGLECKNAEFGICENCHTNIRGQAIHALGKIWHPEHFICAACKKPIAEKKFFVHDDKPYCEQDYSNKFMSKCRACGLPIKEVTIQALGATWHKEHFLCKSCSTPLAGIGFYERENSPFCSKCFENQFSKKCAACNQPIVEMEMMALGKNYHPGCFKCTRCKMPFGKTTFTTINNEAYCTKCNEVTQKLLIARND